MRKVGYARVSMLDQNNERQLERLKAYGCDPIFEEKRGGSIKPSDRPAFSACMRYLRPGDTLVVLDLDRLSRNTIDGIATVVQLVKQLGVRFISLNDGEFNISEDGTGDLTPESELKLSILMTIATYERRKMLQRQREAREARVAQGKSVGRPKDHNAQGVFFSPDKEARAKMVVSAYAAGHPVSEICASCGISPFTFYRILKVKGIEASRTFGVPQPSLKLHRSDSQPSEADIQTQREPDRGS